MSGMILRVLYMYEFIWSLQVIEVSNILFSYFTDEETEGKEWLNEFLKVTY